MAMPRATGDMGGRLALDAGALGNLGRQARMEPDKALKAAAVQFEALFLNNLMKSMRAAMPQDGPLASDTSRTYTEMLDAQLAQTLAKKGTGIADMLVKQLSRAIGGAAKSTEPSSEAQPAQRSIRSTPMPLPARNAAPRAAIAAPPQAAQTSAPAATDFVATMRPYAEKAAKALGVPASYLLAQAGLETGWGKHQPRDANGAASHNLFGIKAGASWKGAVVEAVTSEFVDGRFVRTLARFRAYASPQDAFQDFASLLSRNGRYAPALASGSADGYAASMQRAGYATDPAYGDKLARTIRAVARREAALPQSVMAQVAAPPADNTPRAA